MRDPGNEVVDILRSVQCSDWLCSFKFSRESNNQSCSKIRHNRTVQDTCSPRHLLRRETRTSEHDKQMFTH